MTRAQADRSSSACARTDTSAARRGGGVRRRRSADQSMVAPATPTARPASVEQVAVGASLARAPAHRIDDDRRADELACWRASEPSAVPGSDLEKHRLRSRLRRRCGDRRRSAPSAAGAGAQYSGSVASLGGDPGRRSRSRQNGTGGVRERHAAHAARERVERRVHHRRVERM